MRHLGQLIDQFRSSSFYYVSFRKSLIQCVWKLKSPYLRQSCGWQIICCTSFRKFKSLHPSTSIPNISHRFPTSFSPMKNLSLALHSSLKSAISKIIFCEWNLGYRRSRAFPLISRGSCIVLLGYFRSIKLSVSQCIVGMQKRLSSYATVPSSWGRGPGLRGIWSEFTFLWDECQDWRRSCWYLDWNFYIYTVL